MLSVLALTPGPRAVQGREKQGQGVHGTAQDTGLVGRECEFQTLMFCKREYLAPYTAEMEH